MWWPRSKSMSTPGSPRGGKRGRRGSAGMLLLIPSIPDKQVRDEGLIVALWLCIVLFLEPLNKYYRGGKRLGPAGDNPLLPGISKPGVPPHPIPP